MIIAGLILTAFITRLLFMYRGGMSEPDSVVMAAGMARMLSPDTSFAESMLYGKQLNPGIYFIFRSVYPILFDSPAHVMEFLNWFGVVSAAFITWPLYLIFRKMYSKVISAGAILIFIFAPITWELGTYFHPIMPSMTLALISLLAFSRVSSSSKGVLYFVATCLLASVAVIMRTEVLFLILPAAAYILVSENRRKNIVLILAITAISVISYFYLIRIISSPGSSGGQDLKNFSGRFLSMYLRSVSILSVFKTAVWTVLGVGAATAISIAFCFLSDLLNKFRGESISDRQRKSVLVASFFWILPSLMIWLLYPIPITRHYFIIIPALVLLLSELVLKRYRADKIIIVVVSIIILNLTVPEILYRVYNSINPESQKEPHGTFFYYHSRVNERISRYHTMQKKITKPTVEDADNAAPLFIPVNWESYGYALYGMAETGKLVHSKTEEPEPEIFLHEYYVSGRKVILAFSGGFSRKSIPDHILMRLINAAFSGNIVLLPEELTKLNSIKELPENSIISY